MKGAIVERLAVLALPQALKKSLPMEMLDSVLEGGSSSVLRDEDSMAPFACFADGGKTPLVTTTDPFAALDLDRELIADHEIHFLPCMSPPELQGRTNSSVAQVGAQLTGDEVFE